MWNVGAWWVVLLSVFLMHPSMGQAQWPRSWVKPTCLLGWTAPTLNADASPLTDLDHYEVCVAATSGGACVTTYTTPNAETIQASCATLNMTVDPNSYFVRVQAVDTTGNKSVVSNEQVLTVIQGRTLFRR